MDVWPDMNTFLPTGGRVSRRPGDRRMNKRTGTSILVCVKKKDALGVSLQPIGATYPIAICIVFFVESRIRIFGIDVENIDFFPDG